LAQGYPIPLGLGGIEPFTSNCCSTGLSGHMTARHTSQRCYKCGYTGKDNWQDYKIFRCSKCGLIAHRDRVASRNIATPVLERTDLVSTTNSFQTSKTERFVTNAVCVNDVEMFDVVHLNVSPKAKSPTLQGVGMCYFMLP